MKFTVAIPTHKRPESLSKTLDSVLLNINLPDEVLVIDDDALPIDYLTQYKKIFEKKNIELKYHQKDHSTQRQGLSESKNWATELVTTNILFFLDDDVVLDKNYFEEIMNVWKLQGDDKLFAVGGKISNNRTQSKVERLFYRLFGLQGDCSWDVNRVGFQCWDESVAITVKSHYLHGGVSSYNLSLLKEFGFAEFGGGRTGLEDVELGLRTKNSGYYFYYVPSAQLGHFHEQVGREHSYMSGVKESKNRKEIFKKLCKQTMLNKIHFIWANIGWMLKKILSGNIRYALGMIKGIFI